METIDTGVLYHPTAAVVFYQSQGSDSEPYVEYFDMDSNGCPINAHPLTEQEAKRLAEALDIEQQAGKAFLKPKGIIPPNLLHFNPSEQGNAVWYTKAGKRKLYFTESLGLKSGVAHVPPMLWVADRRTLSVYALHANRKPTAESLLCHAPFFNVYQDGSVCMGTVPVRIRESASLEEFMSSWEHYFFNSYFSHLAGFNPVKENVVLLWKGLLEQGGKFPTDMLQPTNTTLKKLLR
ncbi:PRTRC system protein B [Flavobacterium sp. Sd200]|uniref:PRTRC system protein B n=1 Tax=Flavobacterium sp. Sd200 TaxID=2692211 RepID=UPI001925FA20|nr:PRTRC system protein B [Flavobacterium sp. Sd200]